MRTNQINKIIKLEVCFLKIKQIVHHITELTKVQYKIWNKIGKFKNKNTNNKIYNNIVYLFNKIIKNLTKEQKQKLMFMKV